MRLSSKPVKKLTLGQGDNLYTWCCGIFMYEFFPMSPVNTPPDQVVGFHESFHITLDQWWYKSFFAFLRYLPCKLRKQSGFIIEIHRNWRIFHRFYNAARQRAGLTGFLGRSTCNVCRVGRTVTSFQGHETRYSPSPLKRYVAPWTSHKFCYRERASQRSNAIVNILIWGRHNRNILKSCCLRTAGFLDLSNLGHQDPPSTGECKRSLNCAK